MASNVAIYTATVKHIKTEHTQDIIIFPLSFVDCLEKIVMSKCMVLVNQYMTGSRRTITDNRN